MAHPYHFHHYEIPDIEETKLVTSFQGERTIHHLKSHTQNERSTRHSARSEVWEEIRMLGEGGCGKVYLQRCVRGPRRKLGKKRAVKVVRTGGRYAEYQREIEHMAKFSKKPVYFEYFVQFLGWYERNDTIFIAMEYLPLGDLRQHMERSYFVSEPETKVICYQILIGLKWMHEDGFAHRDIKPDNILIKAMPPNHRIWWVKISDFGIAKRLGIMGSEPASATGTVDYMAPELLDVRQCERGKGKAIDEQAADMWSLGELVFRMLTGSAVFPESNERRRYVERRRGFPSDRLTDQGVSNEASDFIQKIMIPVPEWRRRSAQVISSPWLQDVENIMASPGHFNELSLQQDTPEPGEASSSTMAPQRDPWATGNTQEDPWATRSTHTAHLTTHNEAGTQVSPANESPISETSYFEYPNEYQRYVRDKKLSQKATMTGHWGKINALAISSDGSLIASGSDDGRVKVWDTETTRCRLTLKDRWSLTRLSESFIGSISAISFSPDGASLASGSDHGTVVVWDMRTGKRVRRFTGHSHKNQVTSISFSPDGALVASGGTNGEVRIWNVKTGECTKTLDLLTSIHGVFLSSGGGLVASAEVEATIKIWDIETGKCLRDLELFSSWVETATFLYDGKLAAAYEDTRVQVWDPKTGRRLTEVYHEPANPMNHGITQNPRCVHSIGLSVNGDLATGDESEARIWDSESQQCVRKFMGEKTLSSMVLSLDGRLLARAFVDDFSIDLWRIKS